MRCYVMEDENDATRLVCILQPIVEEVQSVKKSSDTMEVCVVLSLNTEAYFKSWQASLPLRQRLAVHPRTHEPYEVEISSSEIGL